MAQVISDRRDIEFVIHEQLEAENLSTLHNVANHLHLYF